MLMRHPKQELFLPRHERDNQFVASGQRVGDKDSVSVCGFAFAACAAALPMLVHRNLEHAYGISYIALLIADNSLIYGRLLLILSFRILFVRRGGTVQSLHSPPGGTSQGILSLAILHQCQFGDIYFLGKNSTSC